MPTYNSIKELTRGLQQGARLLNDMFIKRKTVSIKYDDAVETLDGDENKVRHLIDFGVIVRSGDTLELDDAYQRFFEEVLAVNEDINIASVQTYISKLKLGIHSFLATDNPARRSQYLREIRHTFKSIENATMRNVVDLKRNVEQTYKQEPNFRIKELRLRDFDEKAGLISELVRQTEKVMDEQTVFFANAAADVGLKQTVSEVREGLHESSHALISISAQIIDYLNRIEYQSKLVKKIRQLKYMKDQLMVEECTDIRSVLGKTNDLWMEKQPKYITRVSLDFLRNDDSALEKQMEANSLRDYILQLIEELPPARKMIFSLSRFEHLSNKEIATRLSISEKTVETQIYRSLQFLREKLSSDVFLACFLIFLANRL